MWTKIYVHIFITSLISNSAILETMFNKIEFVGNKWKLWCSYRMDHHTTNKIML